MTVLKPFFVVPYDFTVINYFSTPVAGFPASNVSRLDHVGLVWRDPMSPTAYFGADLGSALPIDFFACLNANAQTGANINLALRSGAAPGGSLVYTSGAMGFSSTSGSSPFGRVHSHLELPSVQTARYFDIVIGGHSGQLEIAHAVIGKKIQFDRFYDRGFGMGFDLKGAHEVGRNGVPDISPGAVLRTLRFAMSTMTKADFYSKFQPLIVAIRNHKPVYICFDPQADEYRHANTYFGVLRPPPFATIGATHPEWYSQEFEMLSQI